MAVKLIDELQKEIKAAGEAVTQEAYEKAYDHVFQISKMEQQILQSLMWQCTTHIRKNTTMM